MGDAFPKSGVLHIDVTDRVFRPDAKVLEINSKSGLYPLYVAYSIYRAKASNSLFEIETIEQQQQLWDEVIRENIFVICKTQMAKSITRRTLLGFRKGKANLHAFDDLLNQVQNNKENIIKKITRPGFWNYKTELNMLKFDAVVGNPPYQVVNKGDGTGADPIYHKFIDLGYELSKSGTLIHPARFLYNAGKTPKQWNEFITHNANFKIIRLFESSFDVFPSVDIKGGVAITYWDKNAQFIPIANSLREPIKESIKDKVTSRNYIPFSQLVYPRDLYRLTDQLYIENPWAIERPSKGHKYDVGSNVFKVFPELFKDYADSNLVKIVGKEGNIRTERYIKLKYLKCPDNFSSWRVFIAKANGSGAYGETMSLPIIGEPNSGHTATFLSVGKFNTRKEAETVLKYIQTKFFRALLGLLKVTQNTTKEVFQFVPIQDFTDNSDIDWSKSVAEIDQQLYKKYNLTADEITFIESMIKPM